MTVRAVAFNLRTAEELAVLAPDRDSIVLYLHSVYPNGVGFGARKPVAPDMQGHYSTSVDAAQAEALKARTDLVIERGEFSILCGDWSVLNEAGEIRTARKQRSPRGC